MKRIIIPARFESSRYPGKPLATIAGQPMITRVAQICIEATSNAEVYVATDDERIKQCCESAGIQTVMTRSDCATGTDRLWDAAQQLPAEIYINVQGDEPLIEPEDILTVIQETERTGAIVNGMCKILSADDYLSRSVPKVVTDKNNQLLYMSRAPIPGNKDATFSGGWKQVCIYGLPWKALEFFGGHSQKTPLEEIEDIEILRFVEAGLPVRMVEVSNSSIAVDYPEDVARVEAALKAKSLKQAATGNTG